MSKLVDRALLAHLTLRAWTGRKHDPSVSKEVAMRNGAAKGADIGRYNKSLLPTTTALKDIHNFDGTIRTFFYQNTLPWGLDGTYLLPTANYLAFMTQFREMKDKRESLVYKLRLRYDALVESAQTALGSLFDPNDYPPADTLDRKFSMELALMQVPNSDFRTQLVDDELALLTAEHQARLNEAETTVVKELWERMYGVVSKMAERLSNPDNILRDTVVGNVQAMCEMLSRLNVTDDPQLESMRIKIENELLVPVDTLRGDLAVRSDTATKAAEITAAMKAFMG